MARNDDNTQIQIQIANLKNRDEPVAWDKIDAPEEDFEVLRQKLVVCVDYDEWRGSDEKQLLPTITTANSSIPTFGFVQADTVPYVEAMKLTNDYKTRSAVLNLWLSKSLRGLTPIEAGTWFQSKNFFESCRDFFSVAGKVTCDALLKEYATKYLERDCDCAYEKTKVDLDNYQKLCQLFRADLANLLPNYAEVQTGEVEKQLAVSRVNITTVKEMLTVMQQLAKKRLGSAIGGGDHSLNFLDVIINPTVDSDNYPEGFMKRRSKKASGMTAKEATVAEDGAITTWDLVSDNENAHSGPYLYTTALAKLIQQEKVDLNRWKAKVGALINAHKETTDANVRTVLGLYAAVNSEIASLDQWGSGSANLPILQMANLDSLVSSLFWVFCICKVETYQDYLRTLRTINTILRKKQSRTAVESELSITTNAFVKRLKPYISQSRNIHLPPHILTIGRLNEIAGTIAQVSVLRLHDSVPKPLVNPRYILHLRSTKSESLSFLTDFYLLEKQCKAVQPDSEDEGIMQSLHMFHQFLLQKKNLYCNTHQVKGNALRVEIIPVQ